MEVVREALCLLEERDRVQAIKLNALRQDIHEGLEALDQGEDKLFDIKAIKRKGRQHLDSQQ